jgi:hypothetical protein
MKIEENKIPSIKVKEHHNSNLLKITIFGITIKKNTHFQICELWDERIFEFVKRMRRLPDIELNSNGWFLDNDFKRLRILINDVILERMSIFISQPRSALTSYHKELSTLTKYTENIKLSTPEQSNNNLHPLLTESIARIEWDRRYTSLPDNIATAQIIEEEKNIKVMTEKENQRNLRSRKRRKSTATKEKSSKEKSNIINDDNVVSDNMETIKKKINRSKVHPRLKESSKQTYNSSTTVLNTSQTNKDDQSLFISDVTRMNESNADIGDSYNKLLQSAPPPLPKVDDIQSLLNVQAFDVFEECQDSNSGDDSEDDDSDGSKFSEDTSDSEYEMIV